MGLRETLNENPGITTAGTAIIILAAIVFIVVSLFRGGSDGAEEAISSKDFFTIDDGETFFVDDRSKVPPFEHNGKQAYRARVFTCDGGKTKFVGWIERYSPEAKKAMEEHIKQSGADSPVLMEDQSGLLLKKPKTGDKGWVTGASPAVMEIREVNCPDGTPAEPVTP